MKGKLIDSGKVNDVEFFEIEIDWEDENGCKMRLMMNEYGDVKGLMMKEKCECGGCILGMFGKMEVEVSGSLKDEKWVKDLFDSGLGSKEFMGMESGLEN